MPTQVIATKLFVPPPRPNAVLRSGLIAQLNAGQHRKLTLISAPAGFGKTSLASAWIAGSGRPAAWLSLGDADNDPTRFLLYLVAAVQTIAPTIGAGVVGSLQSPQPSSIEALLPLLLNELAALPQLAILVLDDYHVLNARPIGAAIAFLVEHLPPQLHLVITTREDPPLPLARLRACGQLTELRAADLRFTPAEVAAFLTEVMGLTLAAEDVATLESRTEGWIAGLQLAAISLQGQQDPTHFISSFTGSHHFVLDYLLEEVLHQQPEPVQSFLLRTSILDRLCGPLCDAVLLDQAASGQVILERIERANLFIVPLDTERRWYRYHHLFADLLRQRLHQRAALSPQDAEQSVAELHRRASQWHEDNGLALEAFQHAAAANDIARAERLIGGTGLPRQVPGAVTAMLGWLASLPSAVLDVRPALWWRYASLLLMCGQTTGVEEKLQAAEAALHGAEADDQTRNLVGQIAATRATLALTQYQVETMLAQSRRALAYLPSSNLSTRARANWTLGVAYQHQGDRRAASGAYTEAIALSQASGDSFTTILATIGLGDIQHAENQLYQAAETYQQALRLLGDPPLPVAGEAHLSLARIFYEWDDLAAAERHGREGLRLIRQFDRGLDRFVLAEVFLARLKLAQGDVAGASALLTQVSQSVHQHSFVHRMADVAAVQVLTLLRQGKLAAAASWP